MSSDVGPRRILLIEDNPSDVYLIRQALAECCASAELVVFDDGDKALSHLVDIAGRDAPRPDVVILDVNLPKRDGIDVLVRYRNSPALVGVPIMVLTSSDSARERMRVQVLGATFVRKPLELDEFLKVGEIVMRLYLESREAP